MQHTPNLTSISDALKIVQTEAKATAEHTAHALEGIKTKLKNNTEGIQQATTNIQQNSNTAEEARAAAKEATEVGKATLKIAREIKNKRLQEQANRLLSYAVVVARSILLVGLYNVQSLKAPSM
jgi:methyl-accepting chemotaxis protein